jgi:hypothetical protein
LLNNLVREVALQKDCQRIHGEASCHSGQLNERCKPLLYQTIGSFSTPLDAALISPLH